MSIPQPERTALDRVGVLARTKKRRIKRVELPAIDGQPASFVCIRSLFEEEHIAFSDELDKRKDRDGGNRSFRRLFLCWVLCDERGKPLFGPQDEELLKEWDVGEAKFLYDEAAEFCGLKAASAKAAEENQAEKN